MKILKGIFGGGETGDLLAALTKSGFSTRQAERFLPVASESIARAAEGLDLTGGDVGDLIDTLLQKIDVAEIAARSGMDNESVSNGLSALLPRVLNLLQGGRLTSLVSGGGLRGLLGGLAGRS